MHEIDFLPVEYRHEHVQRRRQLWGAVVIVAFVALMSTAALTEYQSYQKTKKRFEEALSHYQTAANRDNRLRELRAELERARAGAELYTYLRHPWPRTQILAALAEPLPEQIAFEELRISRQASPGQNRTRQSSRSDREAEQEQLDKLLPAARDLKKLRDNCDQMQIVVTIAGVTSQNEAIHGYLDALGRAELFSSAELDEIEGDQNNPDRPQRFTATIIVRPGYGQPGGPAPPTERTVMRIGRNRSQPTSKARQPGRS